MLRNLLQAHIETFHAIRRLQPEAQIGYCLHYRLFDPANRLSLLDRSAASMQDTFFNWTVLQAAEAVISKMLAPWLAGPLSCHILLIMWINLTIAVDPATWSSITLSNQNHENGGCCGRSTTSTTIDDVNESSKLDNIGSEDTITL